MAFAQASAQSSVRGNLAGTVTDPSNAAIQGAQVSIIGPTGENTAVSDAEGRFLFRVLIPGSYAVRITKEGFKTADVKSAQVVTGTTATISVKLELGSSLIVVEVTAAGVALDTTSTAVQSNFSDTFYRSIPVGRGVLFVATKDIDWIEAEGNYVRLHEGNREHEFRETLTGLEEKLNPAEFLRIHRSTIVNVQRIKEIQAWFHGHHRVLLENGTELRMSRYQHEIARKLGLAWQIMKVVGEFSAATRGASPTDLLDRAPGRRHRLSSVEKPSF